MTINILIGFLYHSCHRNVKKMIETALAEGALWVAILLSWFLPRDLEVEHAQRKAHTHKNQTSVKGNVSYWKGWFWFWHHAYWVSLSSKLSVNSAPYIPLLGDVSHSQHKLPLNMISSLSSPALYPMTLELGLTTRVQGHQSPDRVSFNTHPCLLTVLCPGWGPYHSHLLLTSPPTSCLIPFQSVPPTHSSCQILIHPSNKMQLILFVCTVVSLPRP